MRMPSLERRSPLLLIFILFILLIVISYQIKTEPGTTLFGNVVHKITNPFVRTFFSGINGVSFVWNHYIYLVGAEHENEAMKQDIAQLQMRVMELEERNKQYQELDELLHQELDDILRMDYPTSKDLIFARIIFKNLYQSDQFVIINQGTKDGVSDKMPVIAPEGLVGRIEKAGKYDSRVLLITDPASQIAVKVFESEGETQEGEAPEREDQEGEEQKIRGQDAILSGNSKECFLKYLPKDFVLKEGMQVITSSMDSIFPPGLPVGVVKNKKADSDNREEKIFIVKSFVPFHLLNKVVIIKKVFEELESQPKNKL